MVFDAKEFAAEHLSVELAIRLGEAKPPYAPGVYALFHGGERVYIGVARGKKGLRNRKRNYVSGDERHTTHRELEEIYPLKMERTAYIEQNVLMIWYVTETDVEAEELERAFLRSIRPIWNRR